MRSMMAVLVAAILAAHPSMASVPQTGAQRARLSQPIVTVTRDGVLWTADYEFDRDAPVWAWFRSALIYGSRRPWRPEQWRVATPGVVLERAGNRDILRAVDGGPVPRRVRLVLTPRSENLEADNGVLQFADGSVAMPSGQFDVFPLDSRMAAEAVPHDLSGYPLEAAPALVIWRDNAGPVLFQGERRAEATAAGADTYVLFGQASSRESEQLVTITDPALPAWLGAVIEDFAPRAAGVYSDRLGPGQTSRPTIMASWSGPTPGSTSMGGSVLPGLIVMRFEGAGVVEPTASVLAGARWFIAHESAHFWLGQTVRYEHARDAWMLEGGADLMALRMLAAVDADWDARGALQKEVDDCVALADAPVAGAASRGEHRALYACGAVFALVAEAVQRRTTGGDWFDFVKTLIDANREDGVLTRAEWLGELARLSGDGSLGAEIEGLVDQGSTDAASSIARLFERSGVACRREGDRIWLD